MARKKNRSKLIYFWLKYSSFREYCGQKKFFFSVIKKKYYKMSLNDHENNPIETEFNKLNISDRDSNPVSSHKNCSYCDKPFTEELWCKECDPFKVMEGWTSGNPAIDKFIKDTMCKPEEYSYGFS